MQRRVGIRNGSLFNNVSTLWNGLLAYYTAANTPNDALGTYNGTLVNGATYGTGIINQGFSFDGVNDYVNLGNSSIWDYGTNDFSISIWCYWKTNTLSDPILGVSGYNNTDGGFSLYATTSEKLTLWYRNSGTFQIGGTSDGTFTINNWNHVVLRRTNNTIDLFINNVKYTISTTFTDSLGNSTASTRIGNNGYGLYFVGILDELASFNRSLSDVEVTELYNSGAGKQYPN
jgi:hypothetical protein